MLQTKKPMNKFVKYLLWGIGGFILLGVVAVNSDDSSQSLTAAAMERKKAPVVFDVPALFGKNITELKKVLGKTESETIPTKLQAKNGITGEAEFKKGNHTLLVTYNPITKIPVAFSIMELDLASKDYNQLIDAANVDEENLNYTVKPIKSLMNDSVYSSVEIIPGKRLSQKEIEERKRKIESGFSAWDGSHNELEKYLKKVLNDPGSYEHIETNYWEMDSYLLVKMHYSAKNGFGGRVRGLITAKCDIDGSVLEVISNE